MKDAIEMTLMYPTLPLSILLAFALIYWVVSATGILGDHGDHGLGGDAAHHGDPGMDLSHHAHLSDSAGLAGWMDRFGFSSVPLVFLASLMVLFMWVITYAIHSSFLADVPDGVRWGVGTLVLLGSFLLALVPVALTLIPLRWFMRKLSISTTEERDVRGHEGEVVSPVVDAQGGRVSVSSTAQGAIMVLPATSLSGGTYPLGTAVVVVSYDDQSKSCQVLSKEEFQSQSV